MMVNRGRSQVINGAPRLNSSLLPCLTAPTDRLASSLLPPQLAVQLLVGKCCRLWWSGDSQACREDT